MVGLDKCDGREVAGIGKQIELSSDRRARAGQQTGQPTERFNSAVLTATLWATGSPGPSKLV